MITKNQIATFEQKLNELGKDAAIQYARELIQSLDISTGQLRGEINNTITELDFSSDETKTMFRDVRTAVFYEDYQAKELKKKAKAKAAKASKPSIKKTCEAILKNGAFNLKSNEDKFLNDIKTKRKLTEKQESWLRALADRFSVVISGEFSKKKSATTYTNTCTHDDLGSMGYKHGSTVSCPFCGESVEVW